MHIQLLLMVDFERTPQRLFGVIALSERVVQ
jgi:hypothetical protein